MAFDIKDFLNVESKKEMTDDFIIKRIPANKLHPSDKNFYKMDPAEIESLKETIELVGVKENLVVKPLKNGEYEIISGHKRHRAVTELLEEGKVVSNLLPCKVEDAADDVKNELILIFTNSTQRERSDYCKMQEIQRVRELLEEYAQNNDLPGRKRDIIAGILNTSKTTIGRLDNIRRNIIPEFMEEYKAGNISTSAANEIAGASQERQQILLEKYKETGTINAKEAAAIKEHEEDPYKELCEFAEQAIKESNELVEQIRQQAPKVNEKTEQQTAVTVQRQQDTTDRTSLVISGRINKNKEYSGLNISYFIDAITNTDIFDADFWEDWKNPEQDKAMLFAELTGVFTEFNAASGEPCEAAFEKGFRVTRKEAGVSAEICIKELADLLNALLITEVIQVKSNIDVVYWVKETAREIAGLSLYATDKELTVLQDLALKLKERAGK